ncbi:immune-associated nucleotide-binding protein 5 [Elysia marginata]|uniref:Immune-associated nucleotide-binding protein 5 n=1 Tax=Elysia marginata TaxID=1093978 RepID=A0AAV4I3U8_9GAST|nr:immune-associated nucleotide-binding protein 5 [Elysia marginata]
MNPNTSDLASLKIDCTATRRQRVIVIVTDTQGYGDTRLDSKEKVQNFSKCITAALKANGSAGYHAILFNMRLGRFIEEDKDVLVAVDRLLPNVMSTHGILIFTGGDNFEREAQKHGLTFDQWLDKEAEKSQDFKDLLQKFDWRVVLFNNVTTEETKKNAQLEQLLEKVDNLPSKGERYVNIFTLAAYSEMKETMANSKEDDIANFSIMKFTSILIDTFEDCRRLEDERCEDTQGKWKDLLERCDKIIGQFDNKSEDDLTDFEKSIVDLRKCIAKFIIAEKQEKTEKFALMIEAKERLDKQYRQKKLKRIGFIVGGVTVAAIGLAGVAAAIFLVIFFPPSIRVIIRIFKIIRPYLKHILTASTVVVHILIDRIMSKRRSNNSRLATDS